MAGKASRPNPENDTDNHRSDEHIDPTDNRTGEPENAEPAAS